MLTKEKYDAAKVLIAVAQLEYDLGAEVAALPNPHHSLMSHNERLLTDLAVRLAAALALRSCAGTYERAALV